MTTNAERLQLARAAQGPRTKQTPIIHTVRTADGGRVRVRLTPRMAIALFCTECLGFEGNPKTDCTSPLCPLFPYRRKTMASVRKTGRTGSDRQGNLALKSQRTVRGL